MEKNKGGRPTIYSKELGEKICKRMMKGESLKKISKDNKMPCRSTIHQWLLDKDKKEFLDNYEAASDVRSEDKFDEIEEIADSKGDVQRDRLKIDTRKWYLSKIMPKKYGEKIDITSGDKPIAILGNVYKDKRNGEGNKPQEEN